jgi:hypothetical protein
MDAFRNRFVFISPIDISFINFYKYFLSMGGTSARNNRDVLQPYLRRLDTDKSTSSSQ